MLTVEKRRLDTVSSWGCGTTYPLFGVLAALAPRKGVVKSDAQQRLRSRGVSELKGFLSNEMGTEPPRGNAAALAA